MATVLASHEESLRTQQDDMALNEVDKAWIRQEITNSHKREGWGHFTGFFKDWGALLGIGGLGVILLTQWTHYVEFRTSTNFRLTGIEKSLQRIDPQFYNTELKDIGAVNKTAIKQAKRIIQTAQEDKIKIDPQTISYTGKKLISASEKDHSAWDVALQFLNYKSFVNAALDIPDSKGSLASHETDTYYYWNAALDWGQPQLRHLGTAPVDSGAHFSPIGMDLNKGRQSGDLLLFIDGGGLYIDNMSMRNVVLSNVHIIYNGGPIEMKNVYFVNCTFQMKADKNTQNLAYALLEPPPAITFSGG